MQDIHGQSITPLQLAMKQRAVVLVFISTDCPISNSYAPLLIELSRTFEEKHITFYTVYTGVDVTADAVEKHRKDFGYTCDALLDPHGDLAKITGAMHTPEVAVVGVEGTLLYLGRIDDQYTSVGHKRFAATTHELKDVLDAIAAGEPVTTPSMPAVGCTIR